MYPNHSTLLGLVVLPRPSILAKPGSVILWGRPVTFVCRGPPRVDIFRLQKRGKLSYVDVKNHLRLKTEAEFPITSVSEDTAGLYRCIYYKQSNWSKYSEFLKLEVIGAPGDISPSPTEADSVTGLSLGQRIQVQPGERPGSPSSLLTQWGPIVASAESLILQCHSDVKYDRFTLSKEGTRDLPQGLGWQPQRGNSQVDFPLGRVNRTHKGQYSGYNLSQEWLVPSDPLDILVAASTSKSYTVGNCVRMGLAGMVLLIPVVILAEAGNSQCRSQHGCMGWRQAGATRD
nr:leukocyte immunoglobulin-like receptor subfamily B member 5 isoform X2 [Loxodonta africana]